MFGLIKKIFIGLLTVLANRSNHTKWVSWSTQKFEIQSTLINLHPNEYGQEFHYYSFMVKLDRCVGSCNNLNDLSNKVCVLNKTEDSSQSLLRMIRVVIKSKTLTKYLSYECKCKLDGTKYNSYQWWKNDKCQCEC